ncbi:MAG TPA: nucleotidyltransferase family protein [Xanthobacteraceae bacterium]|nr:nucleotidyltransferase family protein [Xanthobacteraceae bacterium]
MKDWRNTLIGPQDSILAALAAIDRGALQIALVVDGERHLLGVVTDGDIRKHILKGASLDSAIAPLMNTHPVTANPSEPLNELLLRMRAASVHQLPLVDGERRVIGLVTLDELLAAETQPNLVVLMAGGRGSRLKPLTADTPKPMLKIGDRPILEIILLQFREYGFRRFVITMHYLGDQIMEHFGDGSRFGAEISYVQESEPLGTAGALSLLPERPDRPFFVMNGDLLTKLNFASLMAFHQACAAPLTVCVREHALTIPYGVAEISGDHLDRLVEKPTYRHLVNAGIYACSPEILDLVPRGRPSTMVDIIDLLLETGRRPAVFPIHEYWLDIGQHGDFLRAGADYDQVFGRYDVSLSAGAR